MWGVAPGPPGHTQIRCEYCGETVIVPPEARTAAPSQPAQPAMPALPASPARRGRSGWVGCLAVPLILLCLVGFASASVRGIGPTKQIARGSTGVRAADSKIAAINRPLEGTLPRQISYASMRYSITQATISNQVPNASGQQIKYSPDHAYAYIDFTVNNPLIDKNIYIEPNIIQLQTGDGKTYREASSWGDAIDRQATKEGKLYFEVPSATTWQGAKLIFAKPGKEPATLPLDGAAPQPEYPKSLAATGQATAQDLVFKIKSAALDLDSNGERADTGKRFLRLQMQVINNGSGAGGVALTSNHFRLIVDGTPLAPVEYPIELLERSSAKDVTVVFILPATAAQADLQVGEVGRDGLVRIPLSLKP